MPDFDDKVATCFLENQSQLFPEPVATTLEEARAFLEEIFAVVADSKEEVYSYFEEEGLDISGLSEDDLLEADEVFDVGDGRYLIIEG
ncbi:MAG: glyoxalase [Lachnospiraceae bacterium]|nr:glyoxalase [Lachnospiraceae bacterium]